MLSLRGSIFSFNEAEGRGVIMDATGKAYRFERSVLHDVTQIEPGLPLLFLANGDIVTEAMLHPSDGRGNLPIMKFERVDEKSGPGFLAYFVICLLKSFDPTGRAQRIELWSFTLWRVAIDAALLMALSLGNIETLRTVYGVYFLLMLSPTLTLVIRRFHDVGQSGLFFSPLRLFAIPWLYSEPSQPFTNRYGRHPKAVRASAAGHA